MLRCLHSLDVLSSFLWLGFDTLHQATPLQLCPPYLSLALTSTCWSSPLCGCPPSSSWLWHFTSLPLLEIDPSHSAWALILLTGLPSECVSFSSSLVCDNLLQVNTVWMLSLLFVDYSTPAPTPNPCIDPSSPYWGSEFRCWITPILLQGYPPQILRLSYTHAGLPLHMDALLISLRLCCPCWITLTCWCPQLAWPVTSHWADLLCTSWCHSDSDSALCHGFRT